MQDVESSQCSKAGTAGQPGRRNRTGRSAACDCGRGGARRAITDFYAMPIRLNLLAEAQAAAEMRRRDPVKRAIMASVVLIALALGWSGYLYLKSMMANSDLGKIEIQ